MVPQPPAVVPIIRDAAMAAKNLYNVQHRGLGWALFVAYSYYMIQFHGIQNLPVDEVGAHSHGGTLGAHMGYSGYSHRVLRLLTEGNSS